MSSTKSHSPTISSDSRLVLCLHCGAGVFAHEKYKEYKRIMKNACKAASGVFNEQKCVRSAVIAATKYLEDSELVNAGTGSSLTLDGTVECDAALLNVNNQRWAAMTAISRVINPIQGVEQLYLKSMEPLSNGRIPPIFLSGVSAEDWCTQNEVPLHKEIRLTQRQQDIYTDYSRRLRNGNNTCDRGYDSNENASKSVSKSRKRKRSELDDHDESVETNGNGESAENGKISLDSLDHHTSRKKMKSKEKRNESNDTDHNHGTCGVIGFDAVTQEMYVSTSSGGIWMKHSGRIGPSALIGSGFDGTTMDIDDDTKLSLGVCASGSGEYLMRYRLSAQCCQRIKQQYLNGKDNDYEHVMDEDVVMDVFNGFRESVPDLGPLRTPTAGCLMMKVTDRSEDEGHRIDVDVHWVHTAQTMGIAILCKNKITACMSDNDEHNKIMMGGRSFQIKEKDQ